MCVLNDDEEDLFELADLKYGQAGSGVYGVVIETFTSERVIYYEKTVKEHDFGIGSKNSMREAHLENSELYETDSDTTDETNQHHYSHHDYRRKAIAYVYVGGPPVRNPS